MIGRVKEIKRKITVRTTTAEVPATETSDEPQTNRTERIAAVQIAGYRRAVGRATFASDLEPATAVAGEGEDHPRRVRLDRWHSAEVCDETSARSRHNVCRRGCALDFADVRLRQRSFVH